MPISNNGQSEKMLGSIFSRNLRSAMKLANLTQAQLAAKVGCTQSDVSRYLSGRIPSGEKLVAIAEAVGSSSEMLLNTEVLDTVRKKMEATKVNIQAEADDLRRDARILRAKGEKYLQAAKELEEFADVTEAPLLGYSAEEIASGAHLLEKETGEDDQPKTQIQRQCQSQS